MFPSPPPSTLLFSLLHLFSISAFLFRLHFEVFLFPSHFSPFLFTSFIQYFCFPVSFFLIPYVLLHFEVFLFPSHFSPFPFTSFIQYFCFPVSYFFSFLMSCFILKFSYFPPIFPLFSLPHLFSIYTFLFRILFIPYALLRCKLLHLYEDQKRLVSFKISRNDNFFLYRTVVRDTFVLANVLIYARLYHQTIYLRTVTKPVICYNHFINDKILRELFVC